MSLQVGSRLGQYEVVAPIGAGGMGEVYRGRDTRLNRDVAIKTLPDALIHSPDRLARFHREATTLASLNHPHIAAVYGLEEQEGRPFLVMELVEGEDLSQLLARGRLPSEDALSIAVQVARALEAAHEKGIVHRDLKPANIKLTADGRVKVLDFGLAKAYAQDTASADLSHSPTLSFQATAEGVILGTAAYMSPEQARGKPVDRRADIWAFGCVLFEMLTGRKPFDGETLTDILATVVQKEPDWTRLPTDTPWRVRDVLRRCLKKNPDERFRDAGDVRLELEETDEPVSVASRKGRLSWGIVAATVALAALAGGLAVRSLNPDRRVSVIRIATTLPSGHDFASVRSRINLSPDGSKIVYPLVRDNRRGLFVRSLSEMEPMYIQGTETATSAFFSPDGAWVAYFAGGKLMRMKVDGAGVPLTIADVVPTVVLPSMGIWDEDGFIYFPGGANLLRVPASGGKAEEATTLNEERGEVAHYWPEPLPGSRALVYTAVVRPSGRQDIVVKSLENGESRVLIERANSARYVPTGHLLFAREGTLFAVPFDAKRLEITGNPFPVVDDLEIDVYGDFSAAQFAVSSSGTLAYLVSRPGLRNNELVWVDRLGRPEAATADQGAFMVPRLSPDGRRIALAALDEQTGQRDVWVFDLDRGTRTRLTFGEGLSTDPVWSRDGRTVIFASTRAGGAFSLFSKAADGTGPASPLLGRQESLIFPRLTLPDGGLLFQEIARSHDLGILRFSPERREEVLLGSAFDEIQPSLSPDGRWLAYVSNESGQEEVFIRPFSGPERRWLVSTGGGAEPLWAPDGRELFYRNKDRMMVVPIETAPDLKPGAPSVLFTGEYQHDPYGNDAHNYDLAPDGKRFLMIRRTVNANRGAQQLNFIFNWLEELERIASSAR